MPELHIRYKIKLMYLIMQQFRDTASSNALAKKDNTRIWCKSNDPVNCLSDHLIASIKQAKWLLDYFLWKLYHTHDDRKMTIGMICPSLQFVAKLLRMFYDRINRWNFNFLIFISYFCKQLSPTLR